jgi:hypothetical protein
MTSGFSSGEVHKMDLDGTIVGKFGRGDKRFRGFCQTLYVSRAAGRFR